MGPLLIVVVLAVIVVIAAMALVVFRRHRAAEARIAAATPMQELTETDIAWRIGLLDDRPIGLSDYFAGAELSELFAGADKESVEPVVAESDSPMLPVLPVAAAAIAATSEPAEAPAKSPKFVAQVPGRRDQDRGAADGLCPSPRSRPRRHPRPPRARRRRPAATGCIATRPPCCWARSSSSCS